MKTIQEIKEKVAKDYHFRDWEALHKLGAASDKVIDEIAKKYAQECIEECSNRAHVKSEQILRFPDSKLQQIKNIFYVDKQSVLSIINELK